jgi:apolipoprotein N-acyltransferase
VFRSALIVRRVPLRDARTVADRLGGWPELVLALVGVLAVATAVARRRRVAGER